MHDGEAISLWRKGTSCQHLQTGNADSHSQNYFFSRLLKTVGSDVARHPTFIVTPK